MGRHLLNIALAAILFAGQASAAVVMGPITNPANGHDYYLLSQGCWTAAEAEAITLGGHLVTINDQAENDFVFNTFAHLHSNDDLWIGFSDAAVEGVFEWVSGEPITFTNWACCIGCGPEPNNCFGDDYGVIWRFGGGLGGEWADLTNCAVAVPGSTPYGVVEVAGPELVLWNKLGSVQEIENSEIGLNGTITGGGFGPGMFGGAYRADFTQDLQASFPKEVMPSDAGTIEFWGKIQGFTTNVYWGPNPHFFQFLDPGRGSWLVGLNGNNGLGLGGITAAAGQFHAATGGFFFPNLVPYEQFLGVGQAEDFHHYALVWDKNGIPGVDNGTRKVVVFLDGQLDSMGFFGGPDILPILGGQLDLIKIGDGQAPTLGTEVVLIDNIKIWNFAKIDFSDRFVEGVDQDVDADGVPDASDNCPLIPNPSQADNDDDGIGNACDECLNDFGPPDNGGCPRPEVLVGTVVENLPSGCDIVVDGRFGINACIEWADITPVVTLGGDSITYQALDADGGDLYLMYDFIGSMGPLAVGEESGVVRFFVGNDLFDVFFIQGGTSGTLGAGDDVRVLRNGLPFDNSLGSIKGAVDFNNTSPNFNQPHNLFELEVVLLQTPETPGGSPPEEGGLYSPDPAFWSAALPGSPLVEVSTTLVDIGADGSVAVTVLEINQPPVASCQSVTVSADTSCQGSADVDNGSFDPEGDPITVDQSPAGPYSLGTTMVTLTVRDDLGASDSCTATVTVVDTIPPEISVSVDPVTLWPPNHRMVGVEAAVSSSDICGAPSVVLTSITSSEPDNATGSGDGNTVDDIQNAAVGTADFNFDLRAERAGGGGGRIYTVTYRAADAAGNETVAEGTVVVEHDRGGSAEPLLLTVDSSSSGAVVNWNPVEGALHYNVIRTNLSNLREVQHGYVLGAVTCIESVSLDESTLGNEDAEVPEPGEVFLYMAEYDDGERSSFGTVSSAKPRQSGECD